MDRFEKRSDRKAFMASGKGICRVDITIAGYTERSGVGFAGNVSRCLLADFAESDARMTGSEFVSGVDFGVAGTAEEGGVRTAVESSGGGLARVAELGCHWNGS